MLGHAALGYYVIGLAFETVTLLSLVSLASFVGPRIASTKAGLRPVVARQWITGGWLFAVAMCASVQLVVHPVLVLAFGRPALLLSTRRGSSSSSGRSWGCGGCRTWCSSPSAVRAAGPWSSSRRSSR